MGIGAGGWRESIATSPSKSTGLPRSPKWDFLVGAAFVGSSHDAYIMTGAISRARGGGRNT